MSAVAAVVDQHIPQETEHKLLRVSCWLVLLLLGAAQAWATRFTMNPDGVSYLDIGDAYWRGDWHNALNAYWSPLYSWILGFFLKLLRPSIFWEYPLVHGVNFLIYVITLACFEFFLRTFIADRRSGGEDLLETKPIGAGESAWLLLGYSLFLLSSITFIGLHLVTPDMLLAGLVYLAAALVLKIRAKGNTAAYLTLGLVLALAYLTKAVMAPLALVFFGTAFYAGRFKTNAWGKSVACVLVFVAVGAPFALSISQKKGRLTFGETGAWNFAVYVKGVDYWVAESPIAGHSMNKLSKSLPIYAFGEHVSGTFPPWYDPTYWHEGVEGQLTAAAELGSLEGAMTMYIALFFLLQLHVTLGAGVLHVAAADLELSLRCSLRNWPLWVPEMAAFLLYSCVHVETRFVAAFSTLLFFAVYSGVRLREPRVSRLLGGIVLFVACTSLLIVVFLEWSAYRAGFQPVYWRAAAALQQNGVRCGDRIGLIWNEKWQAGAAEGAFVPRLIRVKVATEEIDPDAFWHATPETRAKAMSAFQSAGIRAILARNIPQPLQSGWKRLGETDYFAYFFP